MLALTLVAAAILLCGILLVVQDRRVRKRFDDSPSWLELLGGALVAIVILVSFGFGLLIDSLRDLLPRRAS